KGLAKEFLAGIPEDIAILRVDTQIGALEVTVGDAHGRVFKNATESFFTLPERCFGPLPLRNVPCQGHREAAATFPERLASDLHREDRPALAPASGLPCP